MTARAGAFQAGVISAYKSGAETTPTRGNAAAVAINATTIGSAPPIYKNKGWYAAGSAFETWITTPLPGTNFNPATGHFLTDVDYVVLD